MKNKIRLGAIYIADWSPRNRKMFSWDYYYVSPDLLHEVKQCDPDEVILLPNEQYTLVIDYPVSKNYERKIKTGKKGVTRLQLTDKICRHYRKMYEIEDKTEQYGIWGHSIGDLVLISITIDNNHRITLGVDS